MTSLFTETGCFVKVLPHSLPETNVAKSVFLTLLMVDPNDDRQAQLCLTRKEAAQLVDMLRDAQESLEE